MLLINPPVMKPCEPPAGIAKLKGFLDQHQIKCDLLDANIEGLLYLMEEPVRGTDRWTQRAIRNVSSNLDSLKNPGTFQNLDRYKRAVLDLNRLLEMSSSLNCVRLSLANYQHKRLSPVNSADLLQAAVIPEENPFYGYFSQRLSEIIAQGSISTVGFSLTFLSQALTTFAMIGYLKRHFPHLTLVLGGGLVTSWMRKPGWKNPFGGLIDHLVDGPGESTLLSFFGIKKQCPVICKPNYRNLVSNKYLSPGLILPYSSSSGCYWNKCRFCPERAEQNPYDPIPAEKAAENLATMAEDLKPVRIHLLDNAVTPSLMKALCANPAQAPWYGFARITPHLQDMDFCHALKRSGCVMLKLGLESGDQKVLDQEQKGMDLKLASNALKSLKSAGIATYVYLLFGTPSETLVSARRTLDFTVAHSNQIDFLNLALFNLPTHSPDSEGLKTEVLSAGDLSLYSGFVHPKGWHRGLVRQFLDKEFKRHRAIASILRRDPPLFTSNHAPLFCRLFEN